MSKYTLPGLIAGALLAAVTGAANAQSATAVTLTVHAIDAPFTAVLDVASHETNIPIVYDSTVVGELGSSKLRFENLTSMFQYLKTVEPGLTAQRLFISGNAALPAADFLAQRIAFLTNVSATPVSAAAPMIAKPADSMSLVVVKADPTSKPPAGLREVWLVTDEAIRANRKIKSAQDQKIAAALANQPQAGYATAQAGLGFNGVGAQGNNGNQGNGYNGGYGGGRRGWRQQQLQNQAQPQEISPGVYATR